MPDSNHWIDPNFPDLDPIIFADGVVSTPDYGEAGSVFANDGKCFLFNRHFAGFPYTIYLMNYVNSSWTPPQPAPFNSDFDDWDFNVSPDGMTLFFTSKRPVEIKGENSRYGNIWKTTIHQGHWSEPELVPYPINTANSHDSYASITKNGTLYFFSDRDGNIGKCDIFRAKYINNNKNEVIIENLGPVINTTNSEYDLFVDPDEQFLIFCSDRPGGYSDADLYISFIDQSGKLSEPINLGEKINKYGAVCPSISRDGQFFFFHSKRREPGDIFWMRVDFIPEIAQQLTASFSS